MRSGCATCCPRACWPSRSACWCARDLTLWRNSLLTGGMKGNTVNRTGKAFKAALNLAAKLDDRITNAKAWQTGLAAVSEADARDANVVLTAAQCRAVVAAAYDIGTEFGLLVEVARRDRPAHLANRRA